MEALQAGVRIDDHAFDRFLPDDLRLASSEHSTPLAVAMRVAEWLDGVGVRMVVDIGSGVGKLCVAAALCSDCQFIGIEHRARLVEAARGLAQTFGVERRAGFIHGALARGVVPGADAYYLFNPFGENRYGPEGHLDEDVDLGEARYERDIALMEDFLKRAPVGTYVVEYNGFGGHVPSTFETIRLDRKMPNVLRMWQKTRSREITNPR